jgi:hypothetical protein
MITASFQSNFLVFSDFQVVFISPPSILTDVAVIHLDKGDNRNAISSAISSGWP